MPLILALQTAFVCTNSSCPRNQSLAKQAKDGRSLLRSLAIAAPNAARRPQKSLRSLGRLIFIAALQSLDFLFVSGDLGCESLPFQQSQISRCVDLPFQTLDLIACVHP